MILSLFSVVMLFWGHGSRGHQNLSEADNYYKDVKSSIIKTFQEDNGDIIDCIDIYKQPALTHPLLKSHQIQLEPQSVPKPIIITNSKNTSLRVFLKSPECPNGYVPIKRESNEDLVTTKHLNYMTSSMGTNPTNSEAINYYDAVIEYRQKHYGARGYINVWGLANILEDQRSLSSIIILDGPPYEVNTIMAGWMVESDIKTRLFTYWNVNGPNGSSCFNAVCEGFVQVSSEIYPGALIWPLSTFEGNQYEIGIEIYQDSQSGHWWLKFGDIQVGYWPKSLFTHFQDGAYYASWGGHVTSLLNVPSPPMGSGVKPRHKNAEKVAYVRHIEVNKLGNYIDPEFNATSFLTGGSCYGVQNLKDRHSYFGHNAPFGGPGGCID